MTENKSDVPLAEQPAMEKPVEAKRRPRSRSVFAPIVLIGAGVLFLLDNLGVVTLNWQAAWQLWPLALIFLGLNVLVVQLPRPAGTWLSALVALAAVGAFGWLLLSGAPAGRQGLAPAGAADWRAESFAVPRGAADNAAVTLDLSNSPSRIEAGDGDDLVSGTIWTRTELALDTAAEGDTPAVTVGEASGGFSLNPADWFNTGSNPWQIALSPEVPMALIIDGGNGAVDADLSALQLTELRINSGNGASSAALPGGDYALRVDSGNGAVRLVMAEDGDRQAGIDSGNGAVTVLLPEGTAARIEYDAGNGRVVVDERFRQVSGDVDEGVYETAGYATADDRVTFVVDTGNGRFQIAAP